MIATVAILGATFLFVIVAALAVIALVGKQRLRRKYYGMRQCGFDHGFVLPEDL
jgi:hypothetical protein